MYPRVLLLANLTSYYPFCADLIKQLQGAPTPSLHRDTRLSLQLESGRGRGAYWES